MSTSHSDFDPRVAKAFEAIEISYHSLRRIQEHLHIRCQAIHRDSEAAADALSMAWSFVDAVHRLREIARSVPGLNAKHLEVRVLLDATLMIKDFRNYVQHMRNDLLDRALLAEPVWGVLSWLDHTEPHTYYTLMTGAILDGMSYPGPVFDRVKGKFLSRVTLTVKGLPLSMDPVFVACERFVEFLRSWMASEFEGSVELRQGPVIIQGRLDLEPSRGT